MTTRFADHLLDGTHAARPAADAVPVGTLYACADHGLIYQSDGAAWTTWATLGSTTRERLIVNRADLTTDYTTTSTSFVDIDTTNLVASPATPAGGKRYQLTLQGRINHSVAGAIGAFDFTIDGTRMASSSYTGIGIRLISVAATNLSVELSLVIVTNVLPAGAHTIRPQWRTNNGTLTLKSSASEFVQFTAIEL